MSFPCVRTVAGSAILLALSVPSLSAQGLSTTTTITESDLRGHVNFLASDLLGGRDSGHPGAEIAAEYIAAHFARCGLEPVLDDWQMPFALPGAAGAGHATVRLGERLFEGSALLSVPTFSAATAVTAPLAFDGQDVRGCIAVLEADTHGAREAAAAALDAGAAAVVFLREEEVFAQKPDTDMRRMGGSRGPLPGMSPSAGPTMTSLEDLPAELREQLEEQLQSMGLDLDSAQMTFRLAGPEDMPDDFQSSDHGMTFTMGGPPTRRGSPLSAPVVDVALPLQGLLFKAAEDGAPVTLTVQRDGRDESCNVLGWIEGSDPVLKNEYVVLGAHYDHVGQDDQGNIWNGADDNASGTAGLLEIAEALSQMRVKPRRSILLAAWGAEERGLVGSNAFARTPPVPMDRIAAYINLDMIGRNDPAGIDVLAASDALKERAFRHSGEHGLTAQAGQAFFLNASDTAAFVQANVPTLFYFSNTHEDYHKPSDDPDRLDAEKASRVARATFGVLVETANADARPDFARASGGGGMPGMAVAPVRGRRLGVFEAMDSDATGFLVGGVMEGGVGSAAGLQSGDRIVRVGERTVAGSTDLREALESQEDGVPFEIEVLRDGESVVLSGVFGDQD